MACHNQQNSARIIRFSKQERREHKVVPPAYEIRTNTRGRGDGVVVKLHPMMTAPRVWRRINPIRFERQEPLSVRSVDELVDLGARFSGGRS